MNKGTKEIVESINDTIDDVTNLYGDTWDSSLVGGDGFNPDYHAVTSEKINDVVVRTNDGCRESSWLCDYIAAVAPANVKALVAALERNEMKNLSLDDIKDQIRILEETAVTGESNSFALIALRELLAFREAEKGESIELQDLKKEVGSLRYKLTAALLRNSQGAAELSQYRNASKEAVAWTDAEELHDASNGGCGYLFPIDGSANKFADPCRQIMLYAAPQLPAANINHQSNIHSSADAGSRAEIKQPSSKISAVDVGWISCSERMPDRGEDVLACNINPMGGFEEIETAQWHGGKNAGWYVFITSADTIYPTHWQPLPAAPQPADTDSTSAQHESLSK